MFSPCESLWSAIIASCGWIQPLATLYPPARRLVQQLVVLDFRQRLGSSSAGCCESPGIVCHELCRESLLRRHERGRHKASKSSVGPVIPRAAKRGACYSKSTSPLSNALDISISPKACNREPILANGVQPSHCVIPIGSYLFPSCSSTTNIVCDDTTAPEVSRPRRGIPKYLGGPPNCPADSLSPRSALEICSRIALYLRSHPGCNGHGRPLLPLPLRTGLLSEA